MSETQPSIDAAATRPAAHATEGGRAQAAALGQPPEDEARPHPHPVPPSSPGAPPPSALGGIGWEIPAERAALEALHREINAQAGAAIPGRVVSGLIGRWPCLLIAHPDFPSVTAGIARVAGQAWLCPGNGRRLPVMLGRFPASPADSCTALAREVVAGLWHRTWPAPLAGGRGAPVGTR